MIGKIKTIKKRHFTLIECVIALSLGALLTTFLLHLFFQTTMLNKIGEPQKKELLKHYSLKTKLSQVLPEITLAQKKGVLKTTRQGLVFTFHHGIDEDPRFCGEVLSRLYLEKGTLKLAVWPVPFHFKEDPPPHRLFHLLDNAKNLKFSFFEPNAPDEELAIETGHERIYPPQGWSDSWNELYEELPALIKVELQHKEQPISFTFPIDESKKIPQWVK